MVEMECSWFGDDRMLNRTHVYSVFGWMKEEFLVQVCVLVIRQDSVEVIQNNNIKRHYEMKSLFCDFIGAKWKQKVKW